MRTLTIAAVVAAMAVGGTAADAQRLGPQGGTPKGNWRAPMPPQAQPMPAPQPMPQPMPAPAPRPGGWNGKPHPMPNPAPMPRPNPGGWNGGGQWQGGGQWNGGGRGQWNGRSRWGGRVGGFWWAGVQAPGGWNSYVRVKRGKRLPGYWLSPNYMIGDWQMYGLGTPPQGYYWTRYYNDAVLIDGSGTVYDTIGTVDWDRYQGGYAYDDEYTVDGYAAGSPPAGYPAPQGPGPAYGAPYPMPQGPGAVYPAPGYGGSSTTTRTYSYTTGGAYPGAPYPGGAYPAGPAPMPRIAYGETYYTAPGTVTTIVVPGAVTTTTTTTEFVEERTYVAPKRVVRRVVKRKWHPRPKPRCICGS